MANIKNIMLKNKSKLKKWVILVLFILYIIIQFITIMAFPIVHSDEIWLRSIANQMWTDKSYAITESYFDLLPRVVHPFRWFYNALLVLVMPFLGDGVFSIRTISLIFACFSLLIFYRFANIKTNNRWLSLMITATLAVNIQFLYSAHQGRQEMVLFFLMTLGLYLLLQNHSHLIFKLLLITFIALGVHPNSFILAGIFFAALLFKLGPKKAGLYFLGTTGIAFLYWCFGNHIQPDFLTGYLSYGATQGIEPSASNRLLGLYWYFYKLYHQIGGTYDLFDIRMNLILFALILLSTVLWLKVRDLLLICICGLTYILSLFLIGRYNQTAIVFIMMLQTFFIILAYPSFPKRLYTILLALFLLMTGYQTFMNLSAYEINHFYSVNYETVIQEIKKTVPESATVLGNLNILEGVSQAHFFDVRNLTFYRGDLSNYLISHGIEYVILHDEMDYIYRNAPRWNFMYGELHYYLDLVNYLDENATLVKTIDNPLYAMRIARFSGTYPWQTRIYHLNLN